MAKQIKEVEIVDNVIKGVKPTQEQVQEMWDAPLNAQTIRELKEISDRAKDKKPTVKQLELFG